MKHNVSANITDSLVNSGVVPSEDRDLYEYGIRQGVIMIINLVTVILVGVMFGMVIQCVAFMVAYIPLRSYAGGYHAGTQLTCYLLSIPFMIIMLIGIRVIPWNGYICVAVLLFAGIVLFKLTPVEDLNKPLRPIEITVYRKKSLIIATVLSCIAILLWFAGIKQIAVSIIMALFMIAVMLILGVFKNNKVQVKEEKA